jgi:hypothetical protein
MAERLVPEVLKEKGYSAMSREYLAIVTSAATWVIGQGGGVRYAPQVAG